MAVAVFAICPHGRRIAGHLVDANTTRQEAADWVMVGAPIGSHTEMMPTDGNGLEACGECVKDEQRSWR